MDEQPLKLVISAQGVKREIVGNFSLCLNPRVALALKAALARWDAGPGIYGWEDVYPPVLQVPDSMPEDWA